MKLLSADAIRRCLIADPGFAIISADYDQIELRIAAAYAGETALIEAAKRNESLHKVVALKVFGPNYTQDQYRFSKNLDFGWLFGGGAKTLAEQTRLPISVTMALIRDFENEFKNLARFKRQLTDQILRTALNPVEYKTYRMLKSQMYNFRWDTQAGRDARKRVQLEISRLCYRKLGYIITPMGRKLLVDAEKAYAGVNYLIQSTAADVMKQGLLRVMSDEEMEPLGWTVLLPVHDEILGQAPRAEAQWFADRYGEVMTTEFKGVPLSASGKVYGKSWGHGYKKKELVAA